MVLGSLNEKPAQSCVSLWAYTVAIKYVEADIGNASLLAFDRHG